MDMYIWNEWECCLQLLPRFGWCLVLLFPPLIETKHMTDISFHLHRNLPSVKFEQARKTNILSLTVKVRFMYNPTSAITLSCFINIIVRHSEYIFRRGRRCFLHSQNPLWVFSDGGTKMFLNVLRRKDLIRRSHVTTKSTRILQIKRGRFYFSTFFFFSIVFCPHDAESLCCNLIYWCPLPDVLLAFAVEIFFLSQNIKYLTVFVSSCCLYE